MRVLPPLYFWLETLFPMPQGHVSPLTATLPSALFAVALTGMAPPYLLVLEIRGDGGLPAPLSPKSCHPVADGYLRSHHLAAFRVDLGGSSAGETEKESL